MTFVYGALDKFRKCVDIAFVHAVKEEGCVGAMLGKCFQHLPGVYVGAIVKCKRNDTGHVAVCDDFPTWNWGLLPLGDVADMIRWELGFEEVWYHEGR